MINFSLGKVHLCTALAVVAIFAIVAGVSADVFKTIDFEQSEGYPAPQSYTGTPGVNNIGNGPDLNDWASSVNSSMFVWNGVSDGTWNLPSGNYGVPSGDSAFFYDAGWDWDYARTPNWSPRFVPAGRMDDPIFTIEYKSIVLFVSPTDWHVPACIRLSLNGIDQSDTNDLWIYHSKKTDPAGSTKIWIDCNGTSIYCGDYQPLQWASEKLVLDKVHNTATYYYNGVQRASFSILPVASWRSYYLGFYAGARNGLLGTDDIQFGTENSDIFSQIGFEQSEGYPAPQPYTGAGICNIGNGPDLTDLANLSADAVLLAWNGISNGSWYLPAGGYGVQQGKSAFYFDCAWNWAYARTPYYMNGRAVPAERQDARFFTIDFDSDVLFAAPDSANGHVPASINFGFNTFMGNNIGIKHSIAGDTNPRKLWVTYNDVNYDAGEYVYQQWAGERLVLDRLLDQATFYYNGTARCTFPISHIDSWQAYGVYYYAGGKNGVIATDDLRFGTSEVIPAEYHQDRLSSDLGQSGVLPLYIQDGNAKIDGDLSDWDDSEWTAINSSYYPPYCPDVTIGYYSAKWDSAANKVYIAVKVDDTAHTFTDTYTDWNKRDAVELYLHTFGTNPNGSTDYSADQAAAQQYSIGFKTDAASLWSAVGYKNNIPADAGFVCAGKIDGDWLYYEAAMTPFAHYGGLSGQPSTTYTLKPGDIIGVDVIVASADGSTFQGMIGQNSKSGKSADFAAIGTHQLVGGPKMAKLHADTINATVSGIVTAASTASNYFYVESSNRLSGLRLTPAAGSSMPNIGDTIAASGPMSTLTTGERCMLADTITSPLTVDPPYILQPLGLTNKILGGGDWLFAATSGMGQSGVTNGVGLNNIGLLVKTWGRVGVVAADNSWFEINDGSGLNVKVIDIAGYGVPTGHPYVDVTGIVSCELSGSDRVPTILMTSWSSH